MFVCTDSTHPAGPGAEQADTDFTILVQVGVEAISTKWDVMNGWWGGGVIVGQLNVKEE